MPRHYKPSLWRRVFGAMGRKVPPPSPRPPKASPEQPPSQETLQGPDAALAQSHDDSAADSLVMGNVTPLHRHANAAVTQPHDAAPLPAAPSPQQDEREDREDSPQRPQRTQRTNTNAGTRLLILETPSRSLVLGLKWQAIVVDQRRNPDAPLSIARKARATWYAPGVKGVVGYGVPDAQAKERLGRFSKSAKDSAGQRRTAPVCAALLAASQAQDAVFALPLPTDNPDGLVWLLHVQGGRPAGIERLVTLAEALELLAGDFSAVFQDGMGQGGAQLWTELTIPVQMRSSIKIKPYSIRDLAQLPVQPSMHLLPASYRAELAATIRRMPLAVKFMGVTAGLGFLVYSAYHHFLVTPQMQAQQAAREQEEMDHLEMAKAQLRARRNTLTASLAPDLTLAPLRERLNDLPLSIEGWALRAVQCDASLGAAPASDSTGAVAAPLKAWRCTGEYEVANREKFAPYVSLAPLVPAWAQLVTAPPTRFSLGFEVQTPAVPVSLESLPTVAEMDMGYVSQLQQHLKFLKDAVEIKFAPLTVEIPRGMDGAVIPVPADFVLPQRSSLVLTAPVAQLDAMLAALPSAADWRGLRLNVANAQRPQDITMSLTGAIYAK